MEIHKYKSHEEYVKCQVEKTLKHSKNVWTTDEVISYICNYFKNTNPDAKFGICHGVRSGWESKRLKEISGLNIIGTELADVNGDDEEILNWDFHNVKDEWINNVDIIYSNAFDHSYDPEMCLNQWMKCITKKGACFIEWTNQHQNCNNIDCFGANKKEYFALLGKNYNVDKAEIKDKRKTTLFIVRHKI